MQLQVHGQLCYSALVGGYSFHLPGLITMTKILSALLLLALAGLPLACKSSASNADVPCTCGTPKADMHGCAHPACVGGASNPANPDCVCGILNIPKK